MKKIKLKSKRGVTLVEEICGVAVLVIVTGALLGSICLSQTTVAKNSVQENASAKAQEIADTVVTKLSSSSASIPSTSDILNDRTVTHRTTFFGNYSDGEKQYTFTPVSNSDGTTGYNIIVRVYFNGGNNYTDVKAYASNTGGHI